MESEESKLSCKCRNEWVESRLMFVVEECTFSRSALSKIVCRKIHTTLIVPSQELDRNVSFETMFQETE